MTFLSNSPCLAAAVVAALAALLCRLVLGGLLASGLAWKLAVDVPNARSMHVRPTPRMGGWGIVPVGLVLMVAAAPRLWPVALLTLGLAVVSQVDDRRGLPARVRFVAHLIAAIGAIALYGDTLPWYVWPIGVLAIAWLINLYNFMDGADGLAGGMALFGFGAYALIALAGPAPLPALGAACAAVAGAALGFLLLNFHPARLFLGDAGSISLGFLAGALGLWGWRHGAWPLWVPPLVFAPFIADASVTLAKRLLRGERFWEAHREHYYQRMVRSGIGHARTALIWYAVMAGGVALAWWALPRPALEQAFALAAWAAVLVLAGVVIDLRWRRFEQAHTQ